MLTKRVICPQRIRQVPRQFSWIDQRLVRHKHLCKLSHEAMALYLFLVIVADAQGLSYYGDATIERFLKMSASQRSGARRELCQAALIAYQDRIYQILGLEEANASELTPPIRKSTDCSGGITFAQILERAAGGSR